MKLNIDKKKFEGISSIEIKFEINHNDKDSFKKMVHSKFKTASGSNYKRYVNNKINLMDIYPDKVIRNRIVLASGTSSHSFLKRTCTFYR